MQLTVLGVHRSGTSALTRLLNLMGLYVGGEGSTVDPGVENSKGYWERRDVMALNDEMLAHYDCSWCDLLNWHDEMPEPPQELQQRMQRIVLDMDHHRPWVIKDPRLCQTYPQWQKHMEMPLAIMVWRDPVEVALSLHTRNMPLLHGLAIWEHCTRSTLLAIKDIPHLIVSHADILQQPVQTLKQVHDWLGAQQMQGIHLPSDAEITAFIDPSLHRAKAQQMDENVPIAAEITQLHKALQQGKAPSVIAPLSGLSQQVFALYHQTGKQQRDNDALAATNNQQYTRIGELEARLHEASTQTRIGELEAKMFHLQDELTRMKNARLIARMRKLLAGKSREL